MTSVVVVETEQVFIFGGKYNFKSSGNRDFR